MHGYAVVLVLFACVNDACVQFKVSLHMADSRTCTFLLLVRCLEDLWCLLLDDFERPCGTKQ